MSPGLALKLANATLFKGVGGLSSLFRNGEAGDYWEAYSLSGTVDATVQTLPGKRLRHDFSQGTAGSRPLLRQRSDGVRYLDFSSSKSMSVAASTALFKYLHDGTGGTVLALFEYPQSEVTSNFIRTAAGQTQAGFVLQKSATSQNGQVLIHRAVNGTNAATTTTYQIAPSGRLLMLATGYKNDGGASDIFWSFDKGATRLAGAGTGSAPSSADAAQNLTIESSFQGRLYALLVINRILTQAEVAQVYDRWTAACRYPVSAPDLLIGVGGQSNASGRGALIPTSLPTVDGVSIYDKSEEYRQAFEPSHMLLNQPVATVPTEPALASPLFSPVLAAGMALNTAGKTSLWVPCAIGSTSIAQWDTPLTASDRTTLFGAFKYRFLKALSEKGGTPVIVWYGHEGSANLPVADYVNGGVGTAYQTAWTSLVDNIRAEVGAATPLIFVQLASDDTLATAVLHALAGEAQRQTELTLTNAYMVVAHDLARNASSDDIHVSKAGQQALGARLSLAIREHVLSEVVNGTGPRIVGATRASATVTLECDKAINTTAGDYGSLFRVYDNGVEATVSSANRNGGNTSKIDIVCSAPLTGPVTLTYGHRAGPATAARTDFVADSDGLPLPVFGPIAVP